MAPQRLSYRSRRANESGDSESAKLKLVPRGISSTAESNPLPLHGRDQLHRAYVANDLRISDSGEAESLSVKNWPGQARHGTKTVLGSDFCVTGEKKVSTQNYENIIN